MKTFLSILLVGCFLVTSCGDGEVAGPDGVPAETPPSGEVTSPPSSGEVTSPPSGGSPSGDQVVLVWTETGGCEMAGPNCARYKISFDGSVATYRGDEVAANGSIGGERVATWWAAAEDTDFPSLISRLGPGEMTAAFDGTDYMLELPSNGVELSSVDVDFDQTEPFFAWTVELVDLAARAAPLEPVAR